MELRIALQFPINFVEVIDAKLDKAFLCRLAADSDAVACGVQ